MTLSYNLNRYLLVALLGSHISVFAQEKTDNTTPNKAVSEEIEIVRAYKPILADAVKIRRSPDLETKKTTAPKVKYDLLDKRLEVNSDIKTLEAQKLVREKEEDLQNNFVKLGGGNLASTLGALHLGTSRDDGLQAGLNLNHWGMNSGKLYKQRMSEQRAGIYGRSSGNSIILDGKLGYNRRSNYLYGIDPQNSFVNTDPQKQLFNTFEGDGEIFNRVDPDDTDKLVFAAKLNGYIFNNNLKAKENSFAISGGVSKNFSRFQLGLNALADITATKYPTVASFQNNLIKANPYIKLDGDKFRLTAGINYIGEFGTNSKTHFFPNANFDFSIISNYLAVFAEVNGDVRKTRIKELSYINPFINENLEIKNQVDKLNIVGGVKGTLSAGIGYKAYVSHKTVENFLFFANDSISKQTFNAEYESGNTNILGITGEVNIKLSNVARIDGKFELNQYNLKNELNAWHHPSIRISSTASFNIAQKVKIDADVYFQGETKAKVYTLDPVSNTVLTPVGIQTLKSFADLGLGAEYQHSKRIAAFVKFNNLLGTDYQRYLYYPNFGFNVVGGVSYGF